MEFRVCVANLNVAAIGKDTHIIDCVLDQFGITHKSLQSHKDITDENMVFCVNYYQLIPHNIIDKLTYGAWTFHGSDLPKGRGWAPLGWALINCDSVFTLTLFKVDSGMDTGMYYKKASVPIIETDTIDSLRIKAFAMTTQLAKSMILDAMATNAVLLHEQVGEPTYFSRRLPADSELDIDKTLKELWPLIRACHNDNYPAFFKVNGRKIIIKYEVEE